MYYCEYYNTLPGPEDAFSNLDRAAFRRLFKRACKAVHNYNMDGKLHLFLKHKHSSVQENEVMVESEYVSADQKFGFATSPSAYHRGLVPSSWTVEDSQILPFEFFDPDLASKIEPITRQNAVSEVAALIVAEHLEQEIGVGLADRPSTRNLARDTLFVERIEDDDHYQQIVLPYRRDEVTIKNPVPTRWIIGGSNDKRMTASLECEPVIVCIPRSPGHAEENQGHINSDDP
ncbi:hypothetical protein HF265_20045 [Rhizobium leguminosarum]|uniref:hypothetical protein n=1 Tax=Rhizobium leguminosarum TaxID=384 RepID=UPI00036894F9|nr:hypothetical protein [Rhizobium leguminosarum]MBY3031351.1 hypothetical protein [Rhizobium leguminosarum]